MRRSRFHLIQSNCRRCGTVVYTGNRSLTGADAAKAQYDRLCVACTTDAEREAMLSAQLRAMTGSR